METLIKKISEISKEHPSKRAVIFRGELLTYKALEKKIVQIGSRLSELGVIKGDIVVFSAVSKPEMIAIYLGIQYIGAVAVYLDKNATLDTAKYIYNDTEAKILLSDRFINNNTKDFNVYSQKKIYSEGYINTIEYSVPKEDDLAEIIYTSGTTGRPKGCMLTYSSIECIWSNTIAGIGYNEDDVILIPLPLNHSYALRVLRAGLFIGATIVLQNGFTFAREIQNNIENFGCTTIAIVPALVETIERQMQDQFQTIMGRFRLIEVGAGALSLEQRKQLVNNLPKTLIFNTWGSSETGGVFFFNVTAAVKSGKRINSLGVPIDGVLVLTIDENGNTFKSSKDHPGRMVLKGSMQMVGYWRMPDLTAATLKGGWLYTNDLVYEEDGVFYIMGRIDDIINVGGEKVSPVEIEMYASEYEDIKECACIGVKDTEGILGYVPILFVVSRNGKFSFDNFKIFMSHKVEKYKIPVKCIEIDSLPRNGIKKIDRKELGKIWEDSVKKDISLNETINTILSRRSIRKFKEQEISRDLLEIILKAGYYAPTGNNLQTWRFTIIMDKDKIAKLKDTVRDVAKENKVVFYGWQNPEVMILVSNDKRNRNGCQDSSCAAQNMMLAAWSLGIASVWLNPLVGMRNLEPVKSLLDEYGIPQNHIVWSAVALGYPDEVVEIPKRKTDVIRWI